MPRGDKTRYTDKQDRKAAHIAEGYVKRGASKDEAERRAWATVNKDDGGGKKPGGSGRKETARSKEGKKGGSDGNGTSSSRSKSARSVAAKKGWETRRKTAG
jgi:hypothetical protein